MPNPEPTRRATAAEVLTQFEQGLAQISGEIKMAATTIEIAHTTGIIKDPIFGTFHTKLEHLYEEALLLLGAVTDEQNRAANGSADLIRPVNHRQHQ